MADMMGDSFEATGHPGDLRSNTHLSVGSVLDALDQMNPTWDDFTAVKVLSPLSTDPVISVERDERVTRVDMSAVLAQLTSRRTGQPTVHNTSQVKDALNRWVNTLPVSDREAAAHGIRLIAWADQSCEALALDVVVPRGKRLTPWTRSAAISPSVDRIVRVNATLNALRQVEDVDCIPDGTAVVWRHTDPRLSSVIFADLDPSLRWNTDPYLMCVYTPGYPVVAAPRAAAARLAEETMVDHHLLSFPLARHLTWKEPLP